MLRRHLWRWLIWYLWRSSKRYFWRSPLSQALVVVVALLGVLELSARAFQYARGRTFDDALYGTHYRDYFFLGPSFDPSAKGGAWQGIADLQINSMGFRGPEFPIAKPEGEYRIVTFGGSTSHSGNYPEKLQNIIDKAPEKFGNNVKVINAAVPTWNTTQSLIQLLTRAIHLSPDVIVVFHAINDASQRDEKWLKDLPAVDYRRYNGVLENSSLLYVFVRNYLRHAFQSLALLWPGSSSARPADLDERIMRQTAIFRSNIEHFAAIAKYRGIKLVLVTMPLNHDEGLDVETNRRRAGAFYASGGLFLFLTKKVGIHNQILREVASREEATLIDVAATNFSKTAANFVDLCHFSDGGAQTFAEAVAAGLENVRQPSPAR